MSYDWIVKPSSPEVFVRDWCMLVNEMVGGKKPLVDEIGVLGWTGKSRLSSSIRAVVLATMITKIIPKVNPVKTALLEDMAQIRKSNFLNAQLNVSCSSPFRTNPKNLTFSQPRAKSLFTTRWTRSSCRTRTEPFSKASTELFAPTTGNPS